MKNKILKGLIIVINIIGIICLIYFMIPYIRHDMSIPNPDAMLASYSWDTSGFILTIGLIPLIIANTLAFIFVKTKIRVLYFIPSIVCLIIVGHYLIFATDWKKEETNDPICTIKCVKDEKIYTYKIYEEGNEFSVGMDEKDKFPLGEIDYTSLDTIINSIEKYYKDNNGMCP